MLIAQWFSTAGGSAAGWCHVVVHTLDTPMTATRPWRKHIDQHVVRQIMPMLDMCIRHVKQFWNMVGSSRPYSTSSNEDASIQKLWEHFTVTFSDVSQCSSDVYREVVNTVDGRCWFLKPTCNHIKSCFRACYALQDTWLWINDSSADTTASMWNTAIRPILTYGNNVCIWTIIPRNGKDTA